MAHLLGVDRVSLRFGTRVLFDSLTLGIDDGDRIGVVGPNGAGKSTLLRLLDGIQAPSCQTLWRRHNADWKAREQRRDIAQPDDAMAYDTAVLLGRGSLVQ